MTYLKLWGSTLLKGPNLVCPKPGFTIRLHLNDEEIADQPAVLSFLKHAAQFIDARPSPIKKLKNPKIEGSFNEQVINWICIIAILSQRANGNDASIFRCVDNPQSQHSDLFIAHEFESMGSVCATMAISIVRRLTAEKDPILTKDDLEAYILDRLRAITRMYQKWAPRVETRMFIKIAGQRSIPWRFNDERTKLIEFGYGRKKRIFMENITDLESHNSFALTNDKNVTAKLLLDVGLPGTTNKRAASYEEAKKYALEFGFPVVVKPLMGMQGYGVTPNIQSEDELKNAYEAAIKHHSQVIVERHVKGDDHRMLVIGGKYAGCVKRSITVLVGDGVRTIEKIVEEINKQDFRNRIPGFPKYQITQVPVVTETLTKQGYNWSSIPEKGAQISMHIVPNASQGGMLETIEDTQMHPANIDMAERAALQFDLKLGGIDYLTEDASLPYWESGGAICEVNARPAIDVMQMGEMVAQEKLCRATFELSFKPGSNAELPVIVFAGNDQALGFELKDELKAEGLRVAHKHENGAEIGLAPPIYSDRADKAVEACLWDPSVDVALIQENGSRIQKYGLGFSIFSYVCFTDISQIPNQNIAKINMLLAQSALHGGYYLKDNPGLVKWINSLPDNLRVQFKPVRLNQMKTEIREDIRRLIDLP